MIMAGISAVAWWTWLSAVALSVCTAHADPHGVTVLHKGKSQPPPQWAELIFRFKHTLLASPFYKCHPLRETDSKNRGRVIISFF